MELVRCHKSYREQEKVWNVGMNEGKIFFLLRGRNDTFANEILTFWNYAFENSKEFYVFFKFGENIDAQTLKISKIHWKLRIKQTSVLFCKYLCNEKSNLYQTFNLSSQDRSWPPKKDLCTNTGTCDQTCVGAFTTLHTYSCSDIHEISSKVRTGQVNLEQVN